jgi:hypothetical protein
VTIIAPQEDPFLAGIVDVSVPGGAAGEGGPGGDGGEGGDGGPARDPENPQCRPGQSGPAGAEGIAGSAGREGRDGPRAQVITVPQREVFGANVPVQLADLLWPPAPERRGR